MDPEKAENSNTPPSTILSEDHDAALHNGSHDKLDRGADPGARIQQTKAQKHTEYPTGLNFFLIFASIMIAMFLVNLDRVIVTTAIPKITDDFKSAGDIGWYGSAFFLTSCAFQLFLGKVYAIFSVKFTFLASILVFEIGSAICGAAPNSLAFILGRAIAGIGSAGIFSGAIVAIIHIVPLHKRAMYQGLFGAVFGVSCAAGPLMGGAFTSKLSWRWCFYINLPLGAVAMVLIALLLDDTHDTKVRVSLASRLKQLDFLGTLLMVAGTVCLVLALQWGGLKYPWNSGRIIALFVVAALLYLGFALVQILLPRTATINPALFKQRSIVAGFFVSLLLGSHLMIHVYYLPIWFQAIQGVSALQSGIRLLPLLLALVVSSVVGGIMIRKIGYYTPFLLVGVILSSIGAGLLYTLRVDTPQSQWVGYQVLYGLGLGCSMPAPKLAAQTVLPERDVSVGVAVMFFSQLLGGAIFVPVGQNVLQDQLTQRLSSIPGFDAQTITQNSVVGVTDLPNTLRLTVLTAYNDSLRRVFLVGLILACLAIVPALAMEWCSMKQENEESEHDETSAGKSLN